MKSIFVPLLLLFFFGAYSQYVHDFNRCTDNDCKALQAFKISKQYLEEDNIVASQKWLDVSKNLQGKEQADSLVFYTHSLQSELFYYMGLFQFGRQEAGKALKRAKLQNDSLQISEAFFFEALNLYELNLKPQSAKAFNNSLNYFPEKKHNRFIQTIGKEHIYNNIAQLKLSALETDSAMFYNKKAYAEAIKNLSKRAIANSEQTFGEIYFSLKNNDSAAYYYYNKSLKSAHEYKYYDIALVNYSLLMNASANRPLICQGYYKQGQALINAQTINLFFRQMFYRYALQAFKTGNMKQGISGVQDEIIRLNTEEKVFNNGFIQQISNRYIQNEKHLLTLQLDKLKRQHDMMVLQLLIALLFILLMALTILFFRKKNKIQRILLDQKNEISNDLHDDIGSGLSSILIHADILARNDVSAGQQKVLSRKILSTGKDVSQKLNTFIWSLNDDNDTLQSFCEYLKHYTGNLLEETSIQFEFNLPAEPHAPVVLNGTQRKHLFYCTKELLNNVIKYSEATQMVINISLSGKNSLLITILDNGKGIQTYNHFGNGINNIHKRVGKLGGEVHFVNENGLRVSIKIPV
ncbi:sensor histidine kinase [Flavobacterium sp. RHBU_24]|uniref:sensor histidine kinase n=1 Tax=Flavobacterium sp. RHBU_24 TaxID=3391185 RepID=UPI00398520AF